MNSLQSLYWRDFGCFCVVPDRAFVGSDLSNTPRRFVVFVTSGYRHDSQFESSGKWRQIRIYAIFIESGTPVAESSSHRPCLADESLTRRPKNGARGCIRGTVKREGKPNRERQYLCEDF
ncbi:hypothetical protein [Uliginosibacterium sediminicola]|uniref:Uncharacterized protein n=1 Tax=Uliginosibacterium sediminicola TaxID=2024550 RepID=A0ABU9Z2C8_9RHOO